MLLREAPPPPPPPSDKASKASKAVVYDSTSALAEVMEMQVQLELELECKDPASAWAEAWHAYQGGGYQGCPAWPLRAKGTSARADRSGCVTVMPE
jgi:hypothetical protein